MNTSTIMDLAWEGAQVAFRLIMAARTRRDAEAIVHQLRALGPADRADVGAIERERLAELGARSDEKRRAVQRGEPLHIGGGTCSVCHHPYAVCACDPMTGGPLDGGD